MIKIIHFGEDKTTDQGNRKKSRENKALRKSDNPVDKLTKVLKENGLRLKTISVEEL